MATNLKQNFAQLPQDAAKDLRFGIVVAEWHSDITGKLLDGAVKVLKNYNAKEIRKITVPGSFELTFGAKRMLTTLPLDAIIVIGCIIQGETRHFDFVAQSVTHGITELNLHYNVPVIFCVLTTDNVEQAKERAGGKLGNKGSEAAEAAIKMALINKEIVPLAEKL